MAASQPKSLGHEDCQLVTLGQNDEMALGTIQAIWQAGLNLKDFSAAGIDGAADASPVLMGDSYKLKAEVWKKIDRGKTVQKITM